MSQFTLLKNVKSTSENFTIRVRIVRLWEHPDYRNPKHIQSLEMVLVDDEGNRLQGSVDTNYFSKFKKHLHENKCYVIQNPTVGYSKYKYKYIDSKDIICLNFNSVLTLCPDIGGSVLGLSFTTFQDILEKKIPEQGTIDVIGTITTLFSKEEVMIKKGVMTHKMNLQIKDLKGDMIYMTLWGEYQEKMSKFAEDNKDLLDNVVVVLQYGKTKWFNRKPYVNNSIKVSRLIINEDIPEIRDFKKSFQTSSIGCSSSSNGQTFSSSMRSSMEDEILIQTQFCTVAEFLDVMQVKSNVILGKIVAINHQFPWHYLACDECARKCTVTYLMSEKNNDYALNRQLYSPDVLNGLSFSGLPKHRLLLKVGVPVMLLRNIDQKNGLCNGTRLLIKSLGSRVIEAEIISGNNIGTRTFIPRLKLSPSDNRIAVKIVRRQFPVSLCFAMTINKSQGQSLSRVGLYLKDPVFTHGQLYVALSRVKSRDGLKILILDSDGKASNKTSNVVYKEIFTNL